MMAFYKLFKIIHRRTDTERVADELADMFEKKFYPERHAERMEHRGHITQLLTASLAVQRMLNSF